MMTKTKTRTCERHCEFTPVFTTADGRLTHSADLRAMRRLWFGTPDRLPPDAAGLYAYQGTEFDVRLSARPAPDARGRRRKTAAHRVFWYCARHARWIPAGRLHQHTFGRYGWPRPARHVCTDACRANGCAYASRPDAFCERCGGEAGGVRLRLPHCERCGHHHDAARITCEEYAVVRVAERRAWDPNP